MTQHIDMHVGEETGEAQTGVYADGKVWLSPRMGRILYDAIAAVDADEELTQQAAEQGVPKSMIRQCLAWLQPLADVAFIDEHGRREGEATVCVRIPMRCRPKAHEFPRWVGFERGGQGELRWYCKRCKQDKSHARDIRNGRDQRGRR